MDITVDDDTIVEGLDFKVSTDYLYLPPGEYTVNIFSTGDEDDQPLLSTTLTVGSGEAYTVAAINMLEKLDMKVIEDKTSTSEGMAFFRVGHFSPGSSSIDVVVNGDTLFSNSAYLDVTDYEEKTPATIALEMNVSGTDETLLSFPQTELEPNTLYSFLAVGLAEDEPLMEGIVLADPSMERIPSEMPATGMGGAQSFKEESTILGVILIFLIMVTSFFLVFRQQPWNNNSKN